MSEKIFLVNDNDALIEMHEESYASEEALQSLLENYPNLISGDMIDSENPRKWVCVCREGNFPAAQEGLSYGFFDHLFLDQDGIPTIIEVKRSTDTRIRREVVGQMLDYAANAVYWNGKDIKDKFEENCKARENAPDLVFEKNLGISPDDYDALWDTVNANLRAGKIRMLFVADSIPNELKRIIEFLNEQMNPAEVLGVEIKQFVSQNVKTLVPKVIGQTQEARILKKRAGKRWNETLFFSDLNSRRGLQIAEICQKIYQWSQDRFSKIAFGRGKELGSFVPVYSHKGQEHQAFAVYSSGVVEIHFQWYLTKPPFDSSDRRKEMLAKLNDIPGVSISPDRLEKRPSIDLDIFSGSAELEQFFKIFEWYLDLIKSV